MKFKLKQYIYFVNDISSMRNFYADVLGLSIIENKLYPENEWLELGGDGFKICLHKSPNIGSQGMNKNKIVFAVEDVGKAREYLIGKKIKMEKHNVWEDIEASDGHDPEGNKFQIACERNY
ncbi:MAG: VOC family protein [Ignavibacteria bacterium]